MAPAPLELPSGNSTSRAPAVRRWVTGTFPGRALAFGAIVKLAAFLLEAIAGTPGRFAALDTVGDIGLVTGAAIMAYRLFVDLKRRLLWRVRRKLTVSYIFIGFVPVLLIITFFLLGGVLLLYNLLPYIVQSRVDDLVRETTLLAEMAAVDAARSRTPATGSGRRRRPFASRSGNSSRTGRTRRRWKRGSTG